MSDKKQKKPQKLKARLARGFPDRSSADIRATDAMMARIKLVYERFGFEHAVTGTLPAAHCDVEVAA